MSFSRPPPEVIGYGDAELVAQVVKEPYVVIACERILLRCRRRPHTGKLPEEA